MIYVVHCLDKSGHVAKRMKLVDEHRAYLATKPVDILSSGPLLSEDGSEMIGSLFIVDAANRAEVETFSAGDPFTKAGLFQSVNVQRYGVRSGALSDHASALATA